MKQKVYATLKQIPTLMDAKEILDTIVDKLWEVLDAIDPKRQADDGSSAQALCSVAERLGDDALALDRVRDRLRNEIIEGEVMPVGLASHLTSRLRR